eukprot:7869309-Heterocapsa_arctica.AAC.1
MKLVMWRLTSYGLAWMGCGYDMSNAFPSVHHNYLDNVVYSHCHDQDVQLLSLRHKYAMAFIRGQDNDLLCVRPTTGDLKGDVLAPMKFAAAFIPAIDITVRETKNWADELTLYQHEPITNQVLDTTYCLYADDVGRIGTCISADNAIKRVHHWDASMDNNIKQCGVFQSMSKRQLLFVFRGRGRHAHQRAIQLAATSGQLR